MGAYKSKPFKQECFDDPRGLAPIVALLGGATVHYIITCIFIYWRNKGPIGGIIKMLWAAVIFICAWIQLILDYIVAYRYYAFADPYDFPDRWQRYNCQIFLFSANPNMIHVNALIFCGIAALILDENLLADNEVHFTWLFALYILIAADFSGAFLSPQDGGLITHTFVGSILYIWFFLIFVIVCGGFCCCGWYAAAADGGGGSPSWGRIILTHSITIVILWCFLIYYIVVNNSMIDFYKGDHYIDAWVNTWTERKYDEYLDMINGNWEKEFTFYFMLLSVGG
eukprot:135878_1